MPSMIESVVMRKCNVSYKQSKQIVSMARDFLRLSPDSNLLWSKELENACILVYNTTSCEESDAVAADKRTPSSMRSLQKTKSSSTLKKEEMERPRTKERKARSLSKSRTRKSSKSPTINSENAQTVSNCGKSHEPIVSSSSHGRSSSRIRRIGEFSNSVDLNKSGSFDANRNGNSKDVRSPSARPRRSGSEKSCNSKTSDQSHGSKSPSSISSRRSKSLSTQNQDHALPDLKHVDIGKPISDSRSRSLQHPDRQREKKSNEQSPSVSEVVRQPRSNSESSNDRDSHICKGSWKSNCSEKSVRRYPSPQTERNGMRQSCKRNDNLSAAIDKSGHQSNAIEPEPRRHSLNLKSKCATTEKTTKAKRFDEDEESWVRSHSMSSAKSLSKGNRTGSKFFGSDDDSSGGAFGCTSMPSIKVQKEVSTPAHRRPRSPGPRIGGNSDFDSEKATSLLTPNEQPCQMKSKVKRKSLSPSPTLPDKRTTRRDGSSPSSPKSLSKPSSTKRSSVASTTPTSKKSAVTRRRLSMEELAKACEADPGLRDAIVANFGKDNGGVRLGKYRATHKGTANGDEFTKSLEEWEEHNDDSSESTNATSKSPALQQYAMDNPLSKFIGKLSKTSNGNKDDNTVSTGSGSSTKSKTRMIPVVKGLSPAKKPSSKDGMTESTWLKARSIGKKPSNMTLMSTDFEDPFTTKKKEDSNNRNRLFSVKSVDSTFNPSKAAKCSIENSILSRSSNTTNSTFSSSKDDSEDDIPIVHYAISTVNDEYSEDQIFPEFSERFAKNSGLKRKESVRMSSRANVHDLPVYNDRSSMDGGGEGFLNATKKSSGSSKNGLAPKLPQRKLSISSGFR